MLWSLHVAVPTAPATTSTLAWTLLQPHMSHPYTCAKCARWMRLDESITKASDEQLQSLCNAENDPAPLSEGHFAHWDIPVEIKKAFVERAKQDEPALAASDRYADVFSSLESNSKSDTLYARYPLCHGCAVTIIATMELDLLGTFHERDKLALLERELERLALIKGDMEMSSDDRMRWNRDQNRLECELEKMHRACEETRAALRKLDEEKEHVLHMLNDMDAQSTALLKEEEAVWHAWNEQVAEFEQLACEKERLDANLAEESRILSNLANSNAYTDAFSIDKDAYGMGVINGLRLGRFSASRPPQDQVTWTEVNVAWGQLALLFNLLCRKLGYENPTHKVHARGAQSTVERLAPEHAEYELHATSEWHVGRLFHSRRFDCAMEAFLMSVQDLYMHAKSTMDPALMLPYSYVELITYIAVFNTVGSVA